MSPTKALRHAEWAEALYGAFPNRFTFWLLDYALGLCRRAIEAEVGGALAAFARATLRRSPQSDMTGCGSGWSLYIAGSSMNGYSSARAAKMQASVAAQMAQQQDAAYQQQTMLNAQSRYDSYLDSLTGF